MNSSSNHHGQQRIAGRAIAASGGASSNQFDPWIIWVTFRRCWPWAVPAGAVLACIAGFFVVKTFVPRFRASYVLEAKNPKFGILPGVMPQMDDLARTEKVLIMNAVVLEPVLGDPTLRKAPSLSSPDRDVAEANLRKNLSISSGGSRSQMVISYEDTDPNAAALVCNAVAESYLKQRETIDLQRISGLKGLLAPQIASWETEVENQRQRVQQLSKNLLGHIPGQKISEMENANDMTYLSGLLSQISELKIELEMSRTSEKLDEETEAEFIPPFEETLEADPVVIRKEPTEMDIQKAIANEPSVVDAKQLVSRYKSQMLQIEDSGMVGINRGHYEEVKQKHSNWLKKLDESTAAARPRVIAMLNERADAEYERQIEFSKTVKEALDERNEAQREAKLAAARKQWEHERKLKRAEKEVERGQLQARLDVLQAQYEEARRQVGESNVATVDLQFAQEEYTVASSVLTKLRDRLAGVKIEGQEINPVETLAVATTPRRPVEEIPVKKLGAASAVAFCIPFLLGLLWELRVQRVTDSSTMERSLSGAPIVGEIARLPAGSQHGKTRRVFEESVDALRANLFLSTETKHVRTLAVVSSMTGEGKSSVSSQLALSIAKASGETVLLVDADLRYPDQHEIFGLDIGPGLSGVLSKKVTLEDAIDSSMGDLIHVLPAGRLDRSPHRLISHTSMREFMDEALTKYSYVVVDTAPVLSASESLAVAAAVDSTLLCVMRDVSRIDSVNRSMNRLEAAGANIAGTVFSGVSATQYAYRYGNYHYAAAGEIEA